MYLKNEKQLHQVEKLIPDTPSDNKQEIVEATPVNAEITSVNINDDKTVIKNECHETVNEAPAINFPVFNTDSSQQSLKRFIVENNLITFVPQQVHAFIVNGQKGKYCVTLFPKGHFSPFPNNHVGFAPKNIKINTHTIEIDCECGKPNAIENMIGCEGIKDRKTLQCMEA